MEELSASMRMGLVCGTGKVLPASITFNDPELRSYIRELHRRLVEHIDARYGSGKVLGLYTCVTSYLESEAPQAEWGGYEKASVNEFRIWLEKNTKI